MKTREIKITQETYENLRALQRENETFEEALKRLALAFRTSGLMSTDPSKMVGEDKRKRTGRVRKGVEG